MKDLMLHCGGKPATLGELDLIPLPAVTDSYQPVGHYALATKILTVTQDVLRNFTLQKESYGLARDGNQFFGVLIFKNSDPNIGMSIGFRNSYDRSMSVGICMGASVFVCDNLAFSGGIVVMKKHTKNVWVELQEKVITTCYNSAHNYAEIVIDAEKFRQIELSHDRGFAHLGVLSGRGVIGPRQFIAAQSEWIKPKHDDFKPRNAWSLYNCVTEVLKSSPPAEVLERHVCLHTYFRELAANPGAKEFNFAPAVSMIAAEQVNAGDGTVIDV